MSSTTNPVQPADAMPEKGGRAIFHVTKNALEIGSHIAAMVRSGNTDISSAAQDKLVLEKLGTIREHIRDVFEAFFIYRTIGSNVFLESVPSSPYIPKHVHSAEGDASCRWTILSARHQSPLGRIVREAPGCFPLVLDLSCSVCDEKFLSIYCDKDPKRIAQSQDGSDSRPTERETTAYKNPGMENYWIRGNISITLDGPFFDHENAPETLEQFYSAWTYRRGV